MSIHTRRPIYAYADWQGLGQPTLMGVLFAMPSRGKEVFSFEYEPSWLEGAAAKSLDPNLMFVRGPQYAPAEQLNFGLFLDSPSSQVVMTTWMSAPGRLWFLS